MDGTSTLGNSGEPTPESLSADRSLLPLEQALDPASAAATRSLPMLNLRRRLLQGAALALVPSLGRSFTKPFRMAYFETYSPLSFRDEHGRLRGLLVDILDDVLFKQMGIPLQHSGYPWVRAQMLARLGEVDGICTIATAARLAYSIASSEIVVAAPRRIFVRYDSPILTQLKQVRDLADLRQLHPVVVSYVGNGWGTENLSGFKIVLGADYESGMKMLIARRGDLMIDNSLTMQFSLKRLSGGDQILMMPATLEASNFQLLISKESAFGELVPAFDKALAQYKRTNAYGDIFKKYGVGI